MAAGVDNMAIIEIEELPNGSFSVNVPDDGDCFYHAVLLSLQILYPELKFGDEAVKDIDIKKFKTYLIQLATDTPDIPVEILRSLTEQHCWAGFDTIRWMVDNLNFNIDVYNISQEKININRFLNRPNTKTIRLIFTGNHYMSFFLGDSSIKVDEARLDTLNTIQTMEKRVDFKKIKEDDKASLKLARRLEEAEAEARRRAEEAEARRRAEAEARRRAEEAEARRRAEAEARRRAEEAEARRRAEARRNEEATTAFEILKALKKAYDIKEPTPRGILDKLKEDIDISELERKLREGGYLSKYYVKYLKYKSKYLALKKLNIH